MGLLGLSQGPPHHYWYLYLDKILPGKGALTVGKKILADQIFAAPFFAITFIFGAGLLEGKSLGRIELIMKAEVYLFSMKRLVGLNSSASFLQSTSLTGLSGLLHRLSILPWYQHSTGTYCTHVYTIHMYSAQ